MTSPKAEKLQLLDQDAAIFTKHAVQLLEKNVRFVSLYYNGKDACLDDDGTRVECYNGELHTQHDVEIPEELINTLKKYVPSSYRDGDLGAGSVTIELHHRRVVLRPGWYTTIVKREPNQTAAF